MPTVQPWSSRAYWTISATGTSAAPAAATGNPNRTATRILAYLTLWHVLVKMTRALAPIIPFITEIMYQNLVRGAFPNSYESVHHTEWPKADMAIVNEKLIYQMDLARRIASLGLSARNNSNLKVRQPLSKVLVHVREGSAELPAELVEIVADELNVKAIEYITNLESVVRYKVLPNNKLLGPKFGASFRQVSELLRGQDPYQVAARVAAGEPVTFELNGETISLTSEEILVSTELDGRAGCRCGQACHSGNRHHPDP